MELTTLLVELVKTICVIIVVAYLITRTRYFIATLERQHKLVDQLVLTVVFGLFSIFGTYSGIRISGAIANVRDLGPMVAGLAAGPIVGVGAGVIGGLHRYLLGGFTRLPCALSTVIAGLIGGVIYKLNKGNFIRIQWAIIFAILMEAFHMGLVLLLSRPLDQALAIVKEVSIPMITANAVGMTIFAFMVHNLIRERQIQKERDRYYKELIKRQRMMRELEIARELQISMLPERFPHIKGYEIDALNIPAREVGGDFYDFIELDNDKVGVVIGDVADKGLPAAIFMALSRSFLRAHAIHDSNIAEVLRRANQLIYKDARKGMFVTVFYGVLDNRNKILRFCNAGHNPPILMHRTGEYELLTTDNVVLGVLEDIRFDEKQVLLSEGDIIVLYTDGVVEAKNSKGDMFGVDRLVETVKDNKALNATELINKIKQEVINFVDTGTQFDDITLMVVKIVG